MKSETLKHKDVRGNELLYLKLTDEKTGNEVLINIGQKTFESVNQISKPKETNPIIEGLQKAAKEGAERSNKK